MLEGTLPMQSYKNNLGTFYQISNDSNTHKNQDNEQNLMVQLTGKNNYDPPKWQYWLGVIHSLYWSHLATALVIEGW